IIVGYRGFLFLKPLFNDGFYYLINSYSGNFQSSPNPYNVGIDTAFLVNKIEIFDDVPIIIESIRHPIPLNTVSGAIDACRHANGRDWWILKCGHRKNTYLRGLLNPYDFELEPYYSSSDSAYTSFQWASFSSDGSKYVHWFGGHIRELQVFDFDRCNGELSNLQTFDFSDIISNNGFIDFTPFSLSPNGTKIYMVRSNVQLVVSQNFQYDLDTQTLTVISDSLGVFSLMPNLKQMIAGSCCVDYTPTPDVPYANILKQPNELGFESEFIPFYNELPLYGFNYTPPNQANHLLGPIDGTICDSLGLNDETAIKEIKQFSFNIFPNPGQNELNFKTDLPLPINAIIRDNQGKVVFESNYKEHKFSITIGLSKLNSGLYFVELQSI
ncbi:MAG: T9SS type A sorting domain-containing protein, partial [Ferruginibacter sp.]